MAIGMAHALPVEGEAFGLSAVVQQHGQAQYLGGGHGIHGVEGVFPHIIAVIGGALVKAHHGRKPWQHPGDDVMVFPQHAPRALPTQKPGQLGADALCRHAGKVASPGVDSLGRAFFNAQPVDRRKPQRPQHAQRVLVKAALSLAHAADHPCAQILLPAEGIHQPLCGMIGHGVDGEIPPGQVLPYIGDEGDAVGMAVIGIRAIYPKGGDLVGHMVQHHGEGAVLQTGFHHMAAAEGSLHFLRRGRGADIPVLGEKPQQAVPDAPAHRIGPVAPLVQAGKNPRRRLRQCNAHVHTSINNYYTV